MKKRINGFCLMFFYYLCAEFLRMRVKNIYIILVITAVLLSGCAKEFNAVYKSNDYLYKYEFAKTCFVEGKFSQASVLLGDLVTIMKGTSKGEECLFLYAVATYRNGDYDSASEIFKKYSTSYPQGLFAEEASYLVGESLYNTVPEPRLDQTPTYAAMKAYQDFMDMYPESAHRKVAETKLYELQDVLVKKELINAQLYYNLGTYFGNCTSGGNNYDACIVTSQNAIKDYPFSKYREDFASLIMKSKYALAYHSVYAKQAERYQDAEDECYGFINEYPDSKDRPLAEKYIEKCKRFIKDGLQEE